MMDWHSASYDDVMIYMQTLSASLVICGDHYIIHSKDQRCGAPTFVCVVSMNKLVHKQSTQTPWHSWWSLGTHFVFLVVVVFSRSFHAAFSHIIKGYFADTGASEFMIFYDKTSYVKYRNGHRFQTSNISSHSASMSKYVHVWHKSIKIYGIHTKKPT